MTSEADGQYRRSLTDVFYSKNNARSRCRCAGRKYGRSRDGKREKVDSLHAPSLDLIGLPVSGVQENRPIGKTSDNATQQLSQNRVS